MSTVVAIGANHRSAPLSLLEAMAIDEQRLAKHLDDLMSRDHVTEAVIISTCNRTEIFVAAEKFHGAFRDVRDFLSDLTFLPPEQFSDHLIVSHDDEAVRHLFDIAAGLDSVVLGEHEILGQLRNSWEFAREAGASGSRLNLLFRHAIEAGKRARTDTEISRHVTSVSHAAVIMAESHLGSFEDRSVAVIGAGSMACGVVDFVNDRGARSITIVNRTAERAEALANGTHGWSSLDELERVLAEADLVFCATSAPGGILDLELVERVRADSALRPLMLVDIAMPRDVHPEVGALDGVTLLDMEALSAFAEVGLSKRRAQVPFVEAIVDEEVQRYVLASSAREVAPLIVELRELGSTIANDELERFSAKLAGLEPAEREAVEGLIHGVMAKLLHTPTVAIKDAAGSPKGERLVESLRELFDL